MFSKDTNEVHLMYSKSGNIEILLNEKTHKVIEELFQSLS